MDDEDTNDNCLTIDTSLQIPIIQENDKLLSSLSSNIPMQSSKTNSDDGDEENHLHLHEDNSSSHPESESDQSQSPQTISSIILDVIINQIESENCQFNSLPIVEDDQIEPEDDDEDEEDNEEEEDEEEETEEQENPDKSSTNKTITIEKERSNIRSTSVKGDSKPMTRTLRSHARKKINNPNSFNANNSNTRRVSSRRRALDSKLLLAAHEKERKRKSMIDRPRKEKESPNDDNHTSSTSDDQTMETTHGKNSFDKIHIVLFPS